MRDDDRQCRICGRDFETIDHLRRDCNEKLNNNKSTQQILHEVNPDTEWMKKVYSIRIESI